MIATHRKSSPPYGIAQLNRSTLGCEPRLANAADRGDLRVDDVLAIDSLVTETEVNDRDLVPELPLNIPPCETRTDRVVG